MNDQPKNGRRIYEDIAVKLAERINSGELTSGSLLPAERELAQAFRTSRTSVREALLSLQSSGLISMRQRARARVTPMNNPAFFNQLTGAAHNLLARPHGVADFQEARVLFECGLARYAARHASPKEIDRLSIALLQNKKAMHDPKLFAKTDLAFHDVLAEIPRNPIFSALNGALSTWLITQRTVPIGAKIRGSIKRAYLGHEAVFEAIAAHDVEASDRAMADHLYVVSQYYWKGVDAHAKRVTDTASAAHNRESPTRAEQRGRSSRD